MKITLPVLNALGRHVLSYTAGAVTAGAALHLLSPGDAGNLQTAIQQIASGVTTMAGGIATIVSVVAAIYAGFSATPAAQAQALVSAVPGTTIVTDPAIAAATPAQPSIVSNAVVQTVAKVCLFLCLIPLAGVLGGCNATLTPQQQAIVETVTTVGISDLCVIGNSQYAKVGNPSSAQRLAKAHMDAACADPSTTAALLVNTYNQLARVVGAKPAVVAGG